MTENLELYRCEICGNLVEVVLSGNGELVCCGEPMKLVKGHDRDTIGLEKHVPVFIEDVSGNRKIEVGSELHPMNDDHYITFIEAISEDRNHIYRQYLYPKDKPEMKIEELVGKAFAREFCNIHGLWEGESD